MQETYWARRRVFEVAISLSTDRFVRMKLLPQTPAETRSKIPGSREEGVRKAIAPILTRIAQLCCETRNKLSAIGPSTVGVMRNLSEEKGNGDARARTSWMNSTRTREMGLDSSHLNKVPLSLCARGIYVGYRTSTLPQGQRPQDYCEVCGTLECSHKRRRRFQTHPAIQRSTREGL